MDYDFLKIEKPVKIDEIDEYIERSFKISPAVDKTVSRILSEVKANGDKAILKFCKEFDCFEAKNINDIRVKEGEISSVAANVRKSFPELIKALEVSYKNIKRYHTAQFKKEACSWTIKQGKGKEIGQIVRPLERVGIYIPGGRYIYPSSVLMTVIPALIAKVKDVVICTPPQSDGNLNEVLLFLFDRLKIKEIYKLGGAQAIAAMAYGTESIKKVDKIVGPGNIYVTVAKKKVFGDVGIDSLAGPSEITILADDSSDASFIAADLISQAEHGSDSRSILLTTSMNIAEKTIESIYRNLDALTGEYGSRINMEVILKSLKKNCKIIYNKDENLLIEICNEIAPEHLEIMTEDAERILKKIKSSGAIFMGKYCPVAVGDYTGGTNHVIPTNGNARFSSPLGVSDFLKRSSVAFYSKDALKKEAKSIEVFSKFENLHAHGYSVRVRFNNKNRNEK
jgi:histidinol dehydrogenase